MVYKELTRTSDDQNFVMHLRSRASCDEAGGFRNTETRRGRSTGVTGTATQRSPGRGFRSRCPSDVCTWKVSQRSHGQDSSGARTRLPFSPLRQKAGQVPCTSLASAASFPDVDYMDYTFAGNAMPKRAEYDGVRRLCARNGVPATGRTRPRRCPLRPRLGSA